MPTGPGVFEGRSETGGGGTRPASRRLDDRADVVGLRSDAPTIEAVRLNKRERQYLRYLATRDHRDLPGLITEKTIIRLIRAGAVEYVPVTAPSPMRGRWVLTERGTKIITPPRQRL